MPSIRIPFVVLTVLCLSWPTPPSAAADLAGATPQELLRVYTQLRELHPGDQWAVAENVTFKRDAATFTFLSGKMVFAVPVADRVLAAAFEGQGTFTLNPPTLIDQRQIARHTKSPKLEDRFQKAVFFFTDGSFGELQKGLNIRSQGGPATNAIQDAMKKFAEHFNDWWSNEHKGNFQMRNLAARMLADLADPTSRGFFLADFKAEHAGDLIFNISWNRDSLLTPGLNNDEEVVLLHYNEGNYHEWWSGFHLAGEYAKSPRPEHRALQARCRKETIEAEITKDNHVEATAEVEYEVTTGAPRLLPLNLRGVLRITAIQDAQGKPISFIQEARELENDPWVILPGPAEEGQTGKMKIAYHEESTRDSRIINQKGSGLYWVPAREAWYPSFGPIDDRTNFVLRFRSPKKFTFIGTGRRLKAEKAKEAFESEWESEIPYGVVGFNYGDFASKSHSDAELTVTAYGGREVPDEIKGVTSAIDMAEMASGPGGPRNLAGQLGIATGGFDTTRMLDYAANVSFNALKLYEYYYGPLPFRSVAVTEQPVLWYGQSWPSLIFLPYQSLMDSTTRHGLRLDTGLGARQFYDTVAPHEMAHQWWGHLVGWKTYHDQWLSEGFAEFSAALWLSKTEPKELRPFWDLRRDWLLHSNTGEKRPVDVGPLWLGAQLPSYLEPDLSQKLIYFKGAYVAEMLRTMMFDPRQKDPDAHFIAMMHDFFSTHGGRNASTEDFRRVVEKHMGQPMDWFFNEWVYGTEIPAYAVKYQVRDGSGGQTTVSISVTQSGVSDQFRMRVPIYIWVSGQPRRLGLADLTGSKTSTADIQLPVKPDKVTLDEGHSILCTARD